MNSSIKKKINEFLKKFTQLDELYDNYPQLKPYFNGEVNRFPTIEKKHLLRHLSKIVLQREFFLPLKCNIEVISTCQLDCDFCYVGEGKLKPFRAKNRMTYDDFLKIWDDIELFTTEVEFTGGEPTLNKEVYQMMQKAKETGVYTTLTTNAQLINEKLSKKILEANPSRVLIALDGIDNNMYESTRKRGDYNVLLNNISELVKAKSKYPNNTTNIQLQTIIHKKTVDHISSFKKIAKEIGANSISTKPLFIWPDSTDEEIQFLKENYLIKDKNQYSYYKLDENGDFIINWRTPGFCSNTQNVHIGSGSEVIPCWYLLRDTFDTDRIIDSNFYDIWFSDKYKNYRYIMENEEISAACKKCIGRYEPDIYTFTIIKEV